MEEVRFTADTWETALLALAHEKFGLQWDNTTLPPIKNRGEVLDAELNRQWYEQAKAAGRAIDYGEGLQTFLNPDKYLKESFNFKEKLGKGTLGEVGLWSCKANDNLYAIKDSRSSGASSWMQHTNSKLAWLLITSTLSHTTTASARLRNNTERSVSTQTTW